jgi:hypothetical protein
LDEIKRKKDYEKKVEIGKGIDRNMMGMKIEEVENGMEVNNIYKEK